MTITIQADEAIMWLRAYHADTLRLGLEAASLGSQMVTMAWQVAEHGGFEKFESDRNAMEERWADLARRHARVTKALQERDAMQENQKRQRD